MRGPSWLYVVLFLIILFLNPQVICLSSAELCSPEQSFALLHFKNSFSINSSASSHCSQPAGSYPKTNSWKEGSDCCSWDGVTCDVFTGHMIGLDLSSCWLVGTIHDNSSLFLLHHLQILNLACNNFNKSEVSPKFGWLSKLTHLNLSSSNFSGSITTQISHLTKLASLDLSVGNLLEVKLDQHSFNKLLQNLTILRYLLLDRVDMSSVEPASLVNLSSSLMSLSLQDTYLDGEFPNDIFHFPFLRWLRLSGNANLRGNLPTSNWSSPLILLDLHWTEFSGKLPDTIGNLIHLHELDLSICHFEGSIPASLGNLTRIAFLNLRYAGFTGQVPSSLSKLERLTYLDLAGNSFSGKFPDVMSNLSKVTHLLLSLNNFSGQMPSSVFNLPLIFNLDFSYNQLLGHFPYNISNLSHLTMLHLQGNLLNGRIPSWLLSLPSLESLVLSENKLKGPIDKFQQSGSVKEVYLENNEIHGLFPNFIFDLVNLTVLDLSLNNLSGVVQPEMFSKPKNLMRVDFSHNTLLSLRTYDNVNFSMPNLVGFSFSSCNLTEFPIFLRASENLQVLDLSNNRISGQISHKDFEFWNHLIFLDLHSNILQGPLAALSPSMMFVSMSHNQLTGEIPSSFCNVSFLEILDLSNNSLSGMIPQCLVNHNNLRVLDLRVNNFQGNIHQICAESNLMQFLNLNGNQLEGPLPSSLVNCSYLKILDVGNNKINDTFPHWLAILPQLQVLILRSNRFHDSIEDSKTKFSFSMLRIVDISDNGFTGLLPTRYFENFKGMTSAEIDPDQMGYMKDFYYQYSIILTMKGIDIEMVKVSTIFTIIDLSNNQFHGQIPKIIGKLNSLKVLNFSYNNLTGHIPSSLENLTEIESLDLSVNKLVGEVPMQLTNLNSLSVLNLSYNQLVEPIPHGKQFDTFENNSYIGNLGLCGLPLSEKCNNNEAIEPTPSISHDEYKSSSWFDWKIIMMGYTSGLVIGLSIGYIVFSTGKPGWFVSKVERPQTKMIRRLRRCIG